MVDSTDMFGAPVADEPQAEPEAPAPTAAELEAAGQVALFGEPEPPAPEPAPPAAPVVAAAAPQPYRVLARKYRPQTFAELIGQDAMVQTLGNAIKRGRLAHAFLMTGVRGVGKTSTARLIAKALNCVGADGQGGPTLDTCGVCEPCRAIAEGRHIDVIEMDAASNTGVESMREIIEAVRYAAVSARYKIYIIDEVHMLSRSAFNALLKTLEEPPPHVKFLFATTEVAALPVTVLSRCQRFDLRRIAAPVLADHFAMVCRAEGVAAEDEALAMIAAAADGSVRDGLSILDQAIAHADLAGESESAQVTASLVRDMLGLADKAMQRRLFETVIGNDGAAVLTEIHRQYALGIEPVAMLRATLDIVHKLTVAQFGGGAPGFSAEDRAALDALAKGLSAGQLHRLWQLLLKGHEEVRTSPDPLASAQMALLRVAHAADLPDPGQLAKRLEELAARAPVAGATEAGAAAPSAPSAALDWAALVDRVDHAGHLLVAQTMRDWVRVISLAPGHLRYALAPGTRQDFGSDIRAALEGATGERWQVERTEPGAGETAQASLREVAEAAAAAAEAQLHADPLMQEAMRLFPGAEVLDESEIQPRAWSRRA